MQTFYEIFPIHSYSLSIQQLQTINPFYAPDLALPCQCSCLFVVCKCKTLACVSLGCRLKLLSFAVCVCVRVCAHA